MELDMKKEKHSGDKISEQTLHEILLDIKYRLDHIEDITADDRAVLIKLVKQSNQIVQFLSQIDVEPYEYEDNYEEHILDVPLRTLVGKVLVRYKINIHTPNEQIVL